MSSPLTETERIAFTESYAKRVQGVSCDKCNSSENVIATVRGKPNRKLMEFVKNGGNVKLGGCTKSYKGYCNGCNQFIQ